MRTARRERVDRFLRHAHGKGLLRVVRQRAVHRRVTQQVEGAAELLLRETQLDALAGLGVVRLVPLVEEVDKEGSSGRVALGEVGQVEHVRKPSGRWKLVPARLLDRDHS